MPAPGGSLEIHFSFTKLDLHFEIIFKVIQNTFIRFRMIINIEIVSL